MLDVRIDRLVRGEDRAANILCSFDQPAVAIDVEYDRRGVFGVGLCDRALHQVRHAVVDHPGNRHDHDDGSARSRPREPGKAGCHEGE